MEKCLRFKTRKCEKQFVFFRRCHRWVSGATVVVMSESASINIIFAFSQRWGFHYFIWPTARAIVVFFVGFIVVVKEFIPLWPVTLAICPELTIFAFFSFVTVVFLAQRLGRGHEFLSILYCQVSPSKNKVNYYYHY